MKVIDKNLNQRVVTYLSTVILLIMAYILRDTGTVLLIYGVLIVFSLKKKCIPLIILGACNYLPSVIGVSPIILSIVAMTFSLLYDGLQKRRIKYIRFDFLGLLLLIVFFSLVTGSLYRDITFFFSVLTSTIFCIFFGVYLYNIRMTSREILEALMCGMGVGIIFGVLIQIGFSGFESNHTYRLAIGERADPNSTGLMFAILCVYFFIRMDYEKKKSTFYFSIYVIGLILSILNLLLTQSRGSVLSLVTTLGIYSLAKKKQDFKFNIKAAKNITGIIIIGVIILMFNAELGGIIIDIWNKFSKRLSITESGDGDRIYLLKMSIKSFLEHPIFGTSLAMFKNYVGHIPHNTFSDYMVTNGVVGILFFGVFFVKPLIGFFKFRNNDCIRESYFCYVVCFINILFYSASNEKIIYFLLIVLILSIYEETKKTFIYGENKKIINE